LSDDSSPISTPHWDSCKAVSADGPYKIQSATR
jgi:hypothetical protein